MFKVSDIPDQVLREIAGAYHRRLAITDTESQPAEERDFQRTVYLRTALEWLAHWLNDRDVPAAVPDDVARDAARYRFRRDNTFLWFSQSGVWRLGLTSNDPHGIAENEDEAIDAAMLAAAQKREGE